MKYFYNQPTALPQGIPGSSEVQRKSCDRTFAFYRFEAGPHFRIAFGAVNLDAPVVRIDEPSELRAVGDPFAHLLAHHGKPVGVRFELDHKVRGEMPKAFLNLLAQLKNSGFRSPG